MARINGGEMVVRALEREEVHNVFALHGGHLDAIFGACREHGLRVIDTRHEQAAAHMADGWARATGRPGVAMVTAGPGVTDAVTGVANAYLDAIPMILIGGRSPLLDDELLPLQGGIDQVALMRPITKWAHSVTHVERIPEFVAMAFRQATSGRPGPVFLEIPIDVLFARAEEEKVPFPQNYRPKAPAGPSAAALKQALEWLSEAERPAILAGGGVWFAQAAQALTEFAELTHTPVMANAKARGSISEEHPLCFGAFGAIHPAAHQRRGNRSADLVILLGTRIGLQTGGRNSLIPSDARVIQVDIEPEEIGRGRSIELGIVADCGEFLRQAIAAARGHKFNDHQAWIEQLTAMRAGQRSKWDDAMKTERPIHPARMAREVVQALAPDAIVAADGGETAAWMANAFRARQPGCFLSHGYLGCLGIGIPFALAAKTAHPTRQVVCVIGDGSVGLNFAEFDTAVRHNLPVTVIINNDMQWGMSKHGQDLAWGPGNAIATELGVVHYERAAEGLGAHGEFVEKAEQIAPALRRAFNSGRAACVNIMTDPGVIEPGTLAMYSAFSGGRPPKTAAKAGEAAVEENKSGETMLPYYGKRKID
ncbi:MAG TPA: thiamine pyrophosphate-binding protein [Candidatus Binataceae bacterium]|nr:thiamine pyrophosphate-binding protein [Candidatus Binataceae bacterium]